jgi:hypothetical protein
MRLRDVVDKTNSLIKQHGEVTVRQIYYPLWTEGFYKAYKNTHSFYNSFDKMLVAARERGLVDDAKIIDTIRTSLGGDSGHRCVEDFLVDWLDRFLNGAESYERHLWRNQKVTPILWIEKDALARVVYDVAREYRVEVCPSRGYSSYAYLKTQISKRRPGSNGLTIIHLSDHDPSGLQMTEDLKARAAKYAGYEVPVKRVALTIEQVAQHHLPPNPTKKADSRAKEYKSRFGDNCWELDALPPDVLKAFVRESIESLIDVPQWNSDLRKQEEELEELKKTFEGYRQKLG